MMSELVVAVLILLGAGFGAVAGLGLLRMPDVFIRMHASTKSGTLGVGLTLMAAAIHFAEPGIVARALLIALFVFLTAPIAAHLIGRAAYRTGTPLWSRSVIDDLQERTARTRKRADRGARPGDQASPQAIGGVRNLLFGSTDLHLMRKCPCPVWIHKAPSEPSYERILAAVDVSSTSPQHDSLNTLIMDLASSLAAAEDSPLHVVHAWSVPGESTARSRVFIRMATEQIERMVATERQRRHSAFQSLIARYRPRVPELHDHLLKGQPQVVIPEFARTYEDNLVVMGTIGRTGLPGLLMGNTAEDTLRQVDCAVLTVKPEGFVSPVVPASRASEPVAHRHPTHHDD